MDPHAPYQPTTFADRGASVPCTTPALQGARVRLHPRTGLELVVPNPAGGRGVYVLPWSGVAEVCQPTLHDAQVHEVLSKAETISPQAVREAARHVALDGAAGRPAKAAAQQAQRSEAESKQLTNRHLLVLLEQAGVVADVAEVAALAALLDDLGLGPRAGQAAIPLRLARLTAFRDGIAAWAAAHEDDSGKMAAAIRSLADPAIDGTRSVLAEVRTQVDAIATLIATWRDRPAALTQAAARPDWMLDGWDVPALLWQEAAGEAARAALLPELCRLAPVLPKQAGQWAAALLAAEPALDPRRAVTLNQDWRTGLAALGTVARNEHLLSLGA